MPEITRDDLREAMRRGRRKVPLAPVEAPLPTEREDAMLDEIEALLTATAEPGTTDQREATAEWLQHLDIDDTVGTDTGAVFALLRDIADREPVAPLFGYDADQIGASCVMCEAEVLTPREEQMDRKSKGLDPGPKVPAADLDKMPRIDHRIWCPWVRVTQIVGTKIDGG